MTNIFTKLLFLLQILSNMAEDTNRQVKAISVNQRVDKMESEDIKSQNISHAYNPLESITNLPHFTPPALSNTLQSTENSDCEMKTIKGEIGAKETKPENHNPCKNNYNPPSCTCVVTGDTVTSAMDKKSGSKRGGRPRQHTDEKRKALKAERARKQRATSINIGQEVDRWKKLLAQSEGNVTNQDVAKCLLDCW